MRLIDFSIRIFAVMIPPQLTHSSITVKKLTQVTGDLDVRPMEI